MGKRPVSKEARKMGGEEKMVNMIYMAVTLFLAMYMLLGGIYLGSVAEGLFA